MKKRHLAQHDLSASFERRAPATVPWGVCTYGSLRLVIGLAQQNAVCRLAFAQTSSPRAILRSWQKAWPRTDFIHDERSVAPVAKNIAAGGTLHLVLVGTEFQCAVWQSLASLAAGEVVTYAELARRCGRPKAVRAVGAACGANPVPLLIPCHRVIASDGSLGGFSSGLAVKKKLLQTEGLQQLVKGLSAKA